MRWSYSLLVGLAGAALAGLCLAGQPEFDSASVKIVQPGAPALSGQAGGPGTSMPSIYRTRAWMIQLLETAYGVPDDQIIRGPGWIRRGEGAILYEINATMPPSITKPVFQEMLQNLLAERFHLTIHYEKQDFPAYDLVVAKGGPRLHEAAVNSLGVSNSVPGELIADRDGFPRLPPGPHTAQVLAAGNLRIKYQERSLAELAANLGVIICKAEGLDPETRRPRVIDKTGLAGKYNFVLEFACRGCVAAQAASAAPAPQPAAGGALGIEGPSIFAALERQIGLKLVKVQDVPIDVIVVDHVDKVPSAN